MWHDVEQNTDEWLELRAGKVTGSAIASVMAHYGKAFGDPAKRLATQIAVQQLTGKVGENSKYSNSHMERGKEQEPIARMLYEDMYFCTVTNGGFFDNGFTGCSPDGLVGNGIIEIKSVLASTQYETITANKLNTTYSWQTIFNIRESGVDWCDYVSYCADFPKGKQLFVKRLFKRQFVDQIEQITIRLAQFKMLVNEIKSNIERFND